MNLLSLFSGIGAFEKALTNIGVDYDLVNYCEIDEDASRSYCKVHDVSEDKNLWDVTTVDTSKVQHDVDLLTYGFPCQDISLCGKQAGFALGDGTYTRSGLFFEALRIIKDVQPRVAIAENVKNLTSKKFKDEFATVLDSLDAAGYNCYWKVLDAQAYGAAQHRERVFIVSIRKDIDDGKFEFPLDCSRHKTLGDVLEKNVDAKYRMTFDKYNSIRNWKSHQNPLERVRGMGDVSPTLTARGAGEYHAGMILVDTTQEKTHDIRYDSVAFENGEVRTLTPRECWRLMGFDDEDFNKVSDVKDAILYKQAGNSIVVNVLERLLEKVAPYMGVIE